VWKGHREVCEWLVAPRTSHSDDNGSSGGGGGGGCRFDATNDFGCNAIQWCAQTGDLPMCKWLKQIGLNLGLTNRNGHSAIHKAAVKGQAEICEWLLKPSCNEDGSEDEGGGAGLGLQHLEKDGDGNDPSEMARLEGFGTLAAWLRTETDARRAALDGGA
jgi:ankyrin repeat protein